MKKIITLSINLILGILIFSSCSHNLSLTKRHYNKGYYVDSRKTLKTEKLNNESKTVSGNNNKTIDTPSDNPVVVKSIVKDSSINESFITESTTSTQKATAVNTPNHKTKVRNKAVSNEIIHASKSNAMFADVQKENMESNDDDGGRHLSLFWVIILILLLLWLFGFIFLANALIHIVLIVALVLLLLWLLRVI